MKTIPAILFFILITGCSLRLEDEKAPSVRLSLEAAIDFAGCEQGGPCRVKTPPQRKKDPDQGGLHAFRLMTKLDNTFIFYDAKGSFEYDFVLQTQAYDEDESVRYYYNTPATGKGWGYRGTLSLMPGWAVGGDRFFIAPIVGIEGSHLDMELSYPEKGYSGSLRLGRFGIPVGFHIETTIAHAVTISTSYWYVFSLAEWEAALPGTDEVTQVALRLWPGSLTNSLGDYLWIETGWRWTSYETGAIFLEYEIELSGPFFGFGCTF